MKIKICGLTTENQVKELSMMDEISFIGHIFYTKSSRCLLTRIETVEHCPKVGVFVNACLEEIQLKTTENNCSIIQLHGDETPAFCKTVRQKFNVIKAFGISDEFDFDELIPYLNVVDYFLFDTKTHNHGGSGMKFNWELLSKYTFEIPFFLSGGIGIQDLQIIKQLNHPQLFALDINSQFESRPGMKEILLIKQFIHELNN